MRMKEQWWAVLVSQLRNPWSSWAWGVMCPSAGWPVGLCWGWVGTSFVLLEVGHAYFCIPGYSGCHVQGPSAEVCHDTVHGLVML